MASPPSGPRTQGRRVHAGAHAEGLVGRLLQRFHACLQRPSWGGLATKATTPPPRTSLLLRISLGGGAWQRVSFLEARHVCVCCGWRGAGRWARPWVSPGRAAIRRGTPPECARAEGRLAPRRRPCSSGAGAWRPANDKKPEVLWQLSGLTAECPCLRRAGRRRRNCLACPGVPRRCCSLVGDTAYCAQGNIASTGNVARGAEGLSRKTPGNPVGQCTSGVGPNKLRPKMHEVDPARNEHVPAPRMLCDDLSY